MAGSFVLNAGAEFTRTGSGLEAQVVAQLDVNTRTRALTISRPSINVITGAIGAAANVSLAAQSVAVFPVRQIAVP